MIGVDTNVLVRLLTADDDAQHAVTLEFFGQRTPSDPAFLSAVTIAETIWVLRKTYKFSVTEVGGAIETLLGSDDFVIECREAIEDMRAAAAPDLMTDFLVAHLGQRAGCSHTVTFDRDAAKAIPSMELIA